MEVLTIFLICFHTLFSSTISINQTIRDGEAIVSAQESSELGFFSPSNTSQNRYLGIWYKQFATGTVVWVANIETPITNKFGELSLSPEGLLILRDSTNDQKKIIWSSDTSRNSGKNVVARLLDNSNFMVIIPFSLALVILLGLLVIIFMKRKKKVKTQGKRDSIVSKDGFDLPLFNLSTLIISTDNFSINNKLGEGGFGPVYRVPFDSQWSGYMSPEYACDGIFSTKSDVFSFGVLVLEVVSGKKNRQFFNQDHCHNLVGHAWGLYKEGKTLELADESVIESNDVEVYRSIHIALLCVQHCPEDRPDMSTVVMMLNSDRRLPESKQPGYYAEVDKFGPENSCSMQTQFSNSYATVTYI